MYMVCLVVYITAVQTRLSRRIATGVSLHPELAGLLLQDQKVIHVSPGNQVENHMKIFYFFRCRGPCNISKDKDTVNTDAYFALYCFSFYL